MNLADWRNLAIVILTVQVLIMVLVVGAIIYFSNRGIIKAQQALKHYAPIGQDHLRHLAAMSKQLSEKLVTPVITLQATSAKVRRWRTIFSTSFRS